MGQYKGDTLALSLITLQLWEYLLELRSQELFEPGTGCRLDYLEAGNPARALGNEEFSFNECI